MAHIKKTSAPAPQIAPRMLRCSDAAAYLGIGVQAMRHLHWQGKLRGVMIGRKMLWDVQDLNKYVDALKVRA